MMLINDLVALLAISIIKEQLPCMITFIRHAESLHNEKTTIYVSSSKIVYDWQHLSKDHYFLHQIKYCPQLLDATITQKGRQECQTARKKVQGLHPDLILVSPLNRTLATCHEIFGEKAARVIALPILAQGLRNACDFSIPIQEKKKEYGYVSFQQVQRDGLFWYLNNDSLQNKARYESIVNKNQDKPYLQVLNSIFQYMEETKIYQTPTNLRIRTEKIKVILREYSKTYKNIVVVSHFNIIRYLLAKEFDHNDDPAVPRKIPNCDIIQVRIDDL